MLEQLVVGLSIVVSASLSTAQPEAEKELVVLVAYDTRTGQTERLAGAIVEGVEAVEGVRALLRPQNEVSDEEIALASGIVVGSPVHWGSLSADTKSFLDRVGGVLVDRQELGADAIPHHRLAGAFVTGGSVSSGKELARIAILTAFVNMRFVIVGAVDANGFGTLGAQATTGPADPGLSEAELDEARRFGTRFARVTERLSNSN